MHIDHLVYAAPDLDVAIDDLEGRFGVRAGGGGKHLGVGTHNALLALSSTTFLEVIAPDPEQPTPSFRRPFGLDHTTQAHLAGWAVACEDLDTAIAHARSHRFDPGDAIDMQRTGAAGTVLRWRLTLNALDGGPEPFLISWGDTEHPSRSAPQGLMLDAFEIEHPDPGRLALVLAALELDIKIKPANDAALVARIRCRSGIKELR